MPNEEDKIKTGCKLSDHKGPRVPHLVPVAKCMESKGRGRQGVTNVLMFPGNGTMAKKERKMVM